MANGKDLNKRDKIILVVIIIVILLIGGIWGGIKYKKYKALKRAYPIIKNTSLHVTNALSFYIEESKITYQELFNKLEGSISEIDKNIFELQNLNNSGQKEKFDLMLGYLKGSQELLRSQLACNRKLLDIKIAEDEAQNAEQELSEANYYSIARLTENLTEATQEKDKVIIEYRKASNEFSDALAKFIGIHKEISAFLPPELLINKDYLNKIEPLIINTRTAITSESLVPTTSAPETTNSKEVKSTSSNQEANRFRKDASEVVLDTQTNLEWYVGPDRETTWDEAQSWVSNLSLAEGGWRMPSIAELKGLYQSSAGNRNMTPLLATTGGWIWSGEECGASVARYFNFSLGYDICINHNGSNDSRAFAVRSRR